MTAKINDPSTGKEVDIKWNPDVDQPDYAIQVTVGSSLPGAKQGMQQLSLQLAALDMIDRQALLDAFQYPGRAQINKRMDAKLAQQIQLAGAGINIELAAKAGRGSGGPKQKGFKI